MSWNLSGPSPMVAFQELPRALQYYRSLNLTPTDVRVHTDSFQDYVSYLVEHRDSRVEGVLISFRELEDIRVQLDDSVPAGHGIITFTADYHSYEAHLIRQYATTTQANRNGDVFQDRIRGVSSNIVHTDDSVFDAVSDWLPQGPATGVTTVSTEFQGPPAYGAALSEAVASEISRRVASNISMGTRVHIPSPGGLTIIPGRDLMPERDLMPRPELPLDGVLEMGRISNWNPNIISRTAISVVGSAVAVPPEGALDEYVQLYQPEDLNPPAEYPPQDMYQHGLISQDTLLGTEGIVGIEEPTMTRGAPIYEIGNEEPIGYGPARFQPGVLGISFTGRIPIGFGRIAPHPPIVDIEIGSNRHHKSSPDPEQPPRMDYIALWRELT